MANEEFSAAELEKLRRVFQEAALNDFPNPDRIGCPTDKSVLKSMAAKTLPLTDPAWRHAARCSPCFREIKQFEADLKRSRWGKATALAAIMLIVAGLLVFRGRLFVSATTSYQTATLDLRPFSATRSENEKARNGQPLALSRGRLTLSIILPVGSDSGRYEYKLLNDSLQQVAAGDGEAKMRDGNVVLAAQLDTSSVPPGQYTVWLRQPGYEWRSYRVAVS
jgi:hypothetical protein